MTIIRFHKDFDWMAGEHDHAAVAHLVEQLTLDEKISLVSAGMGSFEGAPDDALGSAAYNPGVPRVGIPAWDESDASIGVTNPNRIRGTDDHATAFPSLTALGATFDVELAARMGNALGEEARQKGVSVQLAGGLNLIREPRGGRIFEYVSEDPLLSGLITGAQTKGIQDQGVVSTLKHFVMNPQESGRVMVSSDISEKNLRESDLLAFELALEHGGARSIMPGYNMVNKKYASENAFLLQEVLKGDWRYPGFVMSDWGATHSTTHSAWAGLDRQSGYEIDTDHYFGQPLRRSVEAGRVSLSRLDEMVSRILAAFHHVGALAERRRPGHVDLEPHARVAREVADGSVVLLTNQDETLPLAQSGGRIAVVGDFAHAGVLSGGGSSTVMPADAHLSEGLNIPQMKFPKVHHAPGPLERIAAAFPDREVVQVRSDELDRLNPDDVAVVLVEKWSTEGEDNVDLAAGNGQDDMVAGAAERAGRVVVVLETAGPVLLPWLAEVGAVVAAWYGGAGGAEAIAGVLNGRINPGGRLPVTWPISENDLPRPTPLDPESTTSNPGSPRVGDYVGIDYDIEGADVGYRWFERTGKSPVFAFGHGLSYTSFEWTGIAVAVGQEGFPEVALTVTNTGDRTGSETPQVYVAPPAGADSPETFRLAGFTKVLLEPGESKTVRLLLDEDRPYSGYDPDNPGWTRVAGDYTVRVARAALGDVELEATVTLEERVSSYEGEDDR